MWKKREMEKGGSKNKTCSTVPSNPLPDDSTTTARPSLTALFEWEAVTLGDVAAGKSSALQAIYDPKKSW